MLPDSAVNSIPKMNELAVAARFARKTGKSIKSDFVAVILKVAYKQFNRLLFLLKQFSFPDISHFEKWTRPESTLLFAIDTKLNPLHYRGRKF